MTLGESLGGSLAGSLAGSLGAFHATPAAFLSNVRLWYRPDAGYITRSGASVATVLNRGSLAGAMTAVSAGTWVENDASLGGRPSILLNGTANYYTLPDLSALTSGHVFIVGRKAADPAASDPKSGGFLLGGDPGNDTHFPFTDGAIYSDVGSAGRHTQGDPAASLASAFWYDVESATNAYTSRVNGTQLFTTATNTVAFPAAPTFGRSGGGTRFWDGWLAELIVCGSVQSAAQRGAYAKYVADWFNL